LVVREEVGIDELQQLMSSIEARVHSRGHILQLFAPTTLSDHNYRDILLCELVCNALYSWLTLSAGRCAREAGVGLEEYSISQLGAAMMTSIQTLTKEYCMKSTRTLSQLCSPRSL
jgi:hypothetical protein